MMREADYRRLSIALRRLGADIVLALIPERTRAFAQRLEAYRETAAASGATPDEARAFLDEAFAAVAQRHDMTPEEAFGLAEARMMGGVHG